MRVSLSGTDQHCRPSHAGIGRVWGACVLAMAALCAVLAGTANAATTTKINATRATKVVTYRGYAMRVPASWPVYHLTARSTACVRFNRHAVYLGSPGAGQRCLADAAGRTEAILAAPLTASAAGKHATGADPLGPVTVREAQPAGGSETQVAIPAHGLELTATWDRHPGVVRRALGAKLRNRVRPAAVAKFNARVRTAAVGRAARAAAKATPHATGSVYQGLGFDPCSTPSEAQMTAWGASPYRAVGVYLGGTNMACTQSNLTAAWVAREWAAGWRLIPTYVGLQAPRNSCGCSAIIASQATAEGSAAAADAVTRAQALGIGPGNPIYDDMEAYSRGGSVTSAVLAFLAGWTSELHALGYVAGVYSSSASGIVDLAAQYGTGYAEPDDIWIANWNGAKSTADPDAPSADWADNQRLHQYRGGHDETYGGVTLNIDNDYLDGSTAFANGVAGPVGPPSLRITTASNGTIRLAASWPGGGPITAWRALGGNSQAALAVVGQHRGGGSSTTISEHNAFPFYAVQALGPGGRLLASSATVATGPHLALWGKSIFVPSRGLIAVPAGCFTGTICQIALTITSGRRVLARTGRERLGSSAGLVYFQLTGAGRSLLARAGGRRLAVKVQARDVSGTAASASMSLVPFSISGPGPRRSPDPPQTLRIVAARTLVSSKGVGGILASCVGSAACPTRTRITVGARTLATTGVESVGANEARYLSFKLSPAGRALLAKARGRGNQLGARATLTGGATVQHAQIVLSSFS